MDLVESPKRSLGEKTIAVVGGNNAVAADREDRAEKNNEVVCRHMRVRVGIWIRIAVEYEPDAVDGAKDRRAGGRGQAGEYALTLPGGLESASNPVPDVLGPDGGD